MGEAGSEPIGFATTTEVQSSGRESRVNIIRAVRGPWGVMALVILAVEAPIGVLAGKLPPQESIWGILVFVTLLGLAMVGATGAVLSGKRAAKVASLEGRWAKVGSDHRYLFTQHGTVEYDEKNSASRRWSPYKLDGEQVSFVIEWSKGSTTTCEGILPSQGHKMIMLFTNSWNNETGKFELTKLAER